MITVPEVGRRTYLTLVGALVSASACAWIVQVMARHEQLPFVAQWAVITAALLLPAAAPMVATYGSVLRSATTALNACAAAAVFVAGYLIAWAAAGAVAYVLESAPNGLAGDRATDVVVLLLAAGYELTWFKRDALAHCRVPLSFVLSSWRDGTAGALDMGARYGMRCIAACASLVVALFALGPTTVVWLAAVGVLLAGELLAPSRLVATRVVALALVGLAVARAVGLI
jgi:predicted metal-binding membrane protein